MRSGNAWVTPELEQSGESSFRDQVAWWHPQAHVLAHRAYAVVEISHEKPLPATLVNPTKGAPLQKGATFVRRLPRRSRQARALRLPRVAW